ncbi:MAG: replication factor A protein 2 [Thelocarpon superellum]|nr:MAG: replication factor A protein 2 [Thelocarpon superellum]
MSYDYSNGYSTTTYGAQGGASGGGFVNQAGSQGGSQASPSGSKYGNDTLRPVTIRQVLEAQQPHPDAKFRIDGSEITQITFVGQIRNVSRQTTNVTYKVDDGTAIVEVKSWIDSDANEMDMSEDDCSKVSEGNYARVWGTMKSFANKVHVGAHVIRKVEDFNEVQYHLLEATLVHCYFTRGPPEQLIKGKDGLQSNGAYGQDGGNAETAMEVAGRTLPPMSNNAKKIYSALRASPQNNEGLHVQNLAAQLGMQIADAMKAGDELLGHGIIFTTVDDETWAVLEF